MWEIERSHSQNRWPQRTKGIFQTVWHHAEFIRWKKKLGMLSVLALVCSISSYMCWGPALLEMAELPMESGEWIPCLTLPLCVVFALSIRLSLSQLISFPIFSLLVLSYIIRGKGRRRGEWESICIGFNYCLGSYHDNPPKKLKVYIEMEDKTQTQFFVLFL